MAALFGWIDIESSIAKQRGFPDLPIVKLAQSRLIETRIIVSERHLGGICEVRVPPSAPEVANSHFALIGQCLCWLPLLAS